MERERSAIIGLFENGRKPAEILKLLNMSDGKRKFVHRTIKRYKETGGTVDRARSGRPSSVTTPGLKKIIRERIRRNPRRSMRKMALELKISRCSISKVVKRDLGMNSFKRKTAHFISLVAKKKRFERCRGTLGQHVKENLDKMLLSDEKLFTVEEATNTQNDRIISSSISAIPERFRYVSRVQKPRSVMVWAGISSVGRTPLIFVPPGVKINSTTYRELILGPVIKDLSVKMFNGGPFVFQQDGAPAHTSNATQGWLRENISDFVSKEDWPPYSPDLNPMDYSIWSILETKASVNSHTSIESLKRKLLIEWDKIPQETIRASIEALPFRIQSVIRNKGGYID